MTGSNRRKFPITNIGSVTLMMILIVLCMVTFAALSLSTSVSDHQAAERSANHTKAYYAASNQAEEQLSVVDGVLQTAFHDAPDQDAYYDLIRAHYAETSDVTLAETNSDVTLSWQNDLSDSQALLVTLKVLYPAGAYTETSGEPQLYQITSWKVISTRDWNGDNSLNLMGK